MMLYKTAFQNKRYNPDMYDVYLLIHLGNAKTYNCKENTFLFVYLLVALNKYLLPMTRS